MDLIHGWLWKNQHLLPLQSAANKKNSYRFPLLEGTCISIWEQTLELLCREQKVPLASLTLWPGSPCQLSHQTQLELPQKRLESLDTGWRRARSNQHGRGDCIWLWLANVSSSSKLPECSLPEVPPGLNYSMILWGAFPYPPSDEPTINLFAKHVVSSWFNASWHYL